MKERLYTAEVLHNGNHYYEGDLVKGILQFQIDGPPKILDLEEDDYGNVRLEWVDVKIKTIKEVERNTY